MSFRFPPGHLDTSVHYADVAGCCDLPKKTSGLHLLRDSNHVVAFGPRVLELWALPDPQQQAHRVVTYALPQGDDWIVFAAVQGDRLHAVSYTVGRGTVMGIECDDATSTLLTFDLMSGRLLFAPQIGPTQSFTAQMPKYTLCAPPSRLDLVESTQAATATTASEEAAAAAASAASEPDGCGSLCLVVHTQGVAISPCGTLALRQAVSECGTLSEKNLLLAFTTDFYRRSTLQQQEQEQRQQQKEQEQQQQQEDQQQQQKPQQVPRVIIPVPRAASGDSLNNSTRISTQDAHARTIYAFSDDARMIAREAKRLDGTSLLEFFYAPDFFAAPTPALGSVTLTYQSGWARRSAQLRSLLFTPSGRFVVTCIFRTVHLVDVALCRRIATVVLPTEAVSISVNDQCVAVLVDHMAGEGRRRSIAQKLLVFGVPQLISNK